MTDHDPRCDFSDPDLQAKYTFSDPAPVCWTEDHAINMTIRDHFAANAMQALIAREITRETKMLLDPLIYARAAYDLADAMLEARKS